MSGDNFQADRTDALTKLCDIAATQQHRAVRYVLSHAEDAKDARRLLDVLGLLEAAQEMREAA